MKLKRHLVFGIAIFLFAPGAAAAPPAPKGPHPRIWIGAATLAAMKAKVTTSTSAAAGVVAACKKITAGQGYITWPEAASTCALAYRLTGDETAAATGIKYWRALIEDDAWDNGKLGNKLGCVAGATAKEAIRAIAHDTGYPIRFIGPHAALAYDWLYDAPGASEELRSQSRLCFKTWSDYYTTQGYMRSMPGSNYQAGYLFAKTLMAVASAGEDASIGDSMWTEAVDGLFGKDLIATGLGPVGSPPPSGILTGGDWVEGWQYGPLSVLEYALAARALEEQGAALPALDAWVDTLVLRYLHATTPSGDGAYVGGDYDDEEHVYLPNHPRVLFAVLAGPGSDQAAGFAAALLPPPPVTDTTPIFPALAEARGIAPVPYPKDSPLAYVAAGARRLYARSAWTSNAYWTAFESAPYLGPDHQHFSASSFVFSRGADHLVVDPSAYGSRSTLPTNALSVDSDVVLGDYKPSQTPWSRADMPFTRTTVAGTAAARSDFAKAFNFADKPSDVPFAVRDFAFLPEGEVVTIDRVRTDRADRKTYLRFRTLAKDLALSAAAPWTATGTVGSSRLVVHAATLSGGTPTIKAIAAGECPSTTTMGSCADARFPVWEYNLVMPGPSALAVHVLDALGTSEDAAMVEAVTSGDVTGASVIRAGHLTHVLVAAAKDGAVGATLGYTVSGGGRHVVFDVPADAAGRYTISATPDNGQCRVALSAGGAQSGRPAIFGLTAKDCTVVAEQDVPPIVIPPRPDAGAPEVAPRSDAAAGKADAGVSARADASTAAKADAGVILVADAAITKTDAGLGVTPAADAATGGDNGPVILPGNDAGSSPAAKSSGCSCRLASPSTSSAGWLLALAGLCALFRRRRLR